MRLAVISDLHIGRGDSVDPFGHEDGAFLPFLDHLEANFEKIVLLGDIWELLRGVLPGREKDELRLARQAHPEIARRFERSRYVYVHGNHDLATRDLESAPEEWSVEADGMKLLFTHGHRHDWILRNARWLAEASICLGGWVARAGLQPVVDFVDRVEMRTRSVSTDPATCSFRQWAVGLARERNADVAITGHTHLSGTSTHGAQMFLNSGTCSEGRTSFLSIDTQAQRFEVCRSW
jgi:predicted phosphodiesterase